MSSQSISPDPSFRPGSDPSPSPSPSESETVTLPGAGETRVVPPGTDIAASPQPVVIQPDLPSPEEDDAPDDKDRKAAPPPPSR